MKRFSLSIETTGISVKDGNRIITVGVFELHDDRVAQHWFRDEYDPEVEISDKVSEITGYTNEYLSVCHSFKDAGEEFLNFIDGAELVIHKADFDVSFINNEIAINFPDQPRLLERCTVIDTLEIFKRLFPCEKGNIESIAKKFNIPTKIYEDLPSAHYYARITAEVYFVLKQLMEEKI